VDSRGQSSGLSLLWGVVVFGLLLPLNVQPLTPFHIDDTYPPHYGSEMTREGFAPDSRTSSYMTCEIAESSVTSSYMTCEIAESSVILSVGLAEF
jgi:hypothetical protein